LQPYIGTVLQNLFQNGVCEEDIIKMNILVTKFSQNSSSSNSVSLNTQGSNDSEKSDNDKSLNIDNKNDRTKYWKSFICNLEKLKDIQLELKEQTENSKKIKKELDYLNKQKQEVAAYLQIAISFINTIHHRISYLKGFVDYFNNDLDKKINISSKHSHLLLFLIVYFDIQKEDKEDTKDT
jgi:hypothetical protein